MNVVERFVEIMASVLNRNRFVEELLPIIMQKVEGALVAGAQPGGANPIIKNLSDTAGAQRMAEFAADVYKDTGAPPNAERLQNFDHPDSGFFASTYRDMQTGNVVLAYRGTEPTSIKDWWTNAKQALGFDSGQYTQAAQVADEVRQMYPNDTIQITGHSLGGGLAAVGAAAIGVTATTFNAAGVNPATFARLGLDSSNLNNLVTNYHVAGEVLSSFQAHPTIITGVVGGVIGAIAGGGRGAALGAGIGAAVGSDIPAAIGRQIELPALGANGDPLSSNPITRHGMDSVAAALEHQHQQEIMGGGW